MSTVNNISSNHTAHVVMKIMCTVEPVYCQDHHCMFGVWKHHDLGASSIFLACVVMCTRAIEHNEPAFTDLSLALNW